MSRELILGRAARRLLPLFLALLLICGCVQPMAFAEEEAEMLYITDETAVFFGAADPASDGGAEHPEDDNMEGEPIELTSVTATFNGGAPGAPVFDGHSLRLGDSPSLLFYVSVPASVTTAAMRFTGKDIEYTDSNPRRSGNRLCFACPLTYLQLQTEVTPILSYNSGMTLTGQPYSAAAYGSALPDTDSARTLVAALLLYGSYAKAYHDGQTGGNDFDYKAYYDAAAGVGAALCVREASGTKNVPVYVREILNPDSANGRTAAQKNMACALLLYNAELFAYTSQP